MILCIVQARMGSSRLPGKIMKRIEGKPALWHLIYRLRHSRLIDEVVIATTTRKKDEAVVRFCRRNQVPYFRGSENNVLDRYYRAARHFGAKNSDVIVRSTSDDVIVDPKTVDLSIRKFLRSKKNKKKLLVSSTSESGLPYGAGVEVFSFAALEKANRRARSAFDREHLSPYMRNNPGMFGVETIRNKKDLSYMRFSIDYPEDLDFVKAIFEKCYRKPGAVFTLEDIARAVKKEPRLLDINGIHNTGLKKWRQKNA